MSRSSDSSQPEIEPALASELSRAAEAGESAPAELDQLLRALEADIEAERGPRAWLRSRPTGLRAALLLSAIGIVFAVAALRFARPDLATYPADRMAWTLGTMVVLLCGCVMVVLRPLQRPALPAWTAPALVWGSLLGLCALYLVQPLEPLRPALDAATLLPALSCLGIGLALGVPVFGLLLLLDRGGVRRALPTAIAAGLAANLVLHIHCPRVQPMHLMLGHLGAAVVLLLVAAVWARARD